MGHMLATGTGGGEGLPWETPLQNVQQSLTGPVAKGVALVAIVGAIGTLLFLHAEMNQFTRLIVFIFYLLCRCYFEPFLGNRSSSGDPKWVLVTQLLGQERIVSV